MLVYGPVIALSLVLMGLLQSLAAFSCSSVFFVSVSLLGPPGKQNHVTFPFVFLT